MLSLIYYLAFLLALVHGQPFAKITTTLSGYRNTTVLESATEPLVKETDAYIYANTTTITYGKVYQDAYYMKPTRVSAFQTTVYTIVSSPITNTEFFVSSAPKITTSDHTLYASYESSAVQNQKEINSQSFVKTGKTVTTENTVSSRLTSTSSPASVKVSSSAPVDPVSQMLTQTGTTTSSTLFSTSTQVPTTKFAGSIEVSVSSKSEQPLVTHAMSSSKQSTTINPSTLTSSKTIVTSKLLSDFFSQTTANVTSVNTSATIQNSKHVTSDLSVDTSSQVSYASTFERNFTSSQYTTVYTSTISTTKVTPVYSVHGNRTIVSSSIIPTLTAIKVTVVENHKSAETSSATSMLSSVGSVPESSFNDLPSTTSTIEDIESTTATSAADKSTVATAETTPVATAEATLISKDLFDSIDTNEPPSVFARQANPLDLVSGVDNNGSPYETNKFYTNLMVGTQNSPAFAYPYTMWKYQSGHYGFAVQHTTKSQYAFGNYDSAGNAQYLVNPLYIASLIFSADSFSSSSFSMEVSDMTVSSAKVNLNNGDSSSYIEIPLVQGMGFSTGIYHGALTPVINSGVGISSLVQEDSNELAQGILKYRVTLLNNVSWLIYVTVPDGCTTSDIEFTVTDTYTIKGSASLDGLIIQLAVAPEEAAQDIFYDQAAGMYVTSFDLEGEADGSSATYSFDYITSGKSLSGSTVVFALPHHLDALAAETVSRDTGIELQSTTKGTMKGYLTTELRFSETLNNEIGWLPWSSQLGGNKLSYSAEQLQLLAEVANKELNVDIKSSISGLNTYYLGKVLDKYAYILLTVSDIIQDESVTRTTLENMKTAFNMLLENTQYYPLLYDTKFGGIISSGDLASTYSGYDFGATYYNDHHFHYGYIIHAAAAIGYVDAKLGGTWAQENKAWVNALVRDVANPSDADKYFPVSRMFDWFHGHSWASGLFENSNGKNEESSSEDYNFAYAMKLWGSVIGDKSMEYRGGLMIAIMKRSMNDYYLYSNDNSVEPSEILGNKVAGILFDNIIDYTTYFGTNTEYKNGIHMLPITPASSCIRGPTFVEEEWNEKLSGLVDTLQNGWGGILRLNQALFDPLSSYSFFSQDSFDSNVYLDNGMSRTWALAFSGGIANSLGLL